MTAVALLPGMAVGLATMVLGFDRTPTIVAAQAVTVVGAPLVAGVLLWLTSQTDVMGHHIRRIALSAFDGATPAKVRLALTQTSAAERADVLRVAAR